MSFVKEFVKPTIVLTIICLVITVLLASSYEITQPIIQANVLILTEASRIEVLPEADTFTQETGSFPEGVEEVYSAANGTGYAITVVSKGYSSDPLKVMVGINIDGTIEKIKILSNAETPGLGSKVSNPEFLGQFNGLDNSMEGLQLISGATISSTAIQRAVSIAFEVYYMVKGA